MSEQGCGGSPGVIQWHSVFKMHVSPGEARRVRPALVRGRARLLRLGYRLSSVRSVRAAASDECESRPGRDEYPVSNGLHGSFRRRELRARLASSTGKRMPTEICLWIRAFGCDRHAYSANCPASALQLSQSKLLTRRRLEHRCAARRPPRTCVVCSRLPARAAAGGAPLAAAICVPLAGELKVQAGRRRNPLVRRARLDLTPGRGGSADP